MAKSRRFGFGKKKERIGGNINRSNKRQVEVEVARRLLRWKKEPWRPRPVVPKVGSVAWHAILEDIQRAARVRQSPVRTQRLLMRPPSEVARAHLFAGNAPPVVAPRTAMVQDERDTSSQEERFIDAILGAIVAFILILFGVLIVGLIIRWFFS